MGMEAIDRLSDQQQDTARILERVVARLEALEHWRDTQERAQERAEDRRDDREEKRPDLLRANAAIALSAVTAAIYVLTYLAQHWRP